MRGTSLDDSTTTTTTTTGWVTKESHIIIWKDTTREREMDIETQELRYQLESQGMDTGMGIIINIRDLDRLTVVALFRHSFYRSTVYTHTRCSGHTVTFPVRAGCPHRSISLPRSVGLYKYIHPEGLPHTLMASKCECLYYAFAVWFSGRARGKGTP